MTARPKATRRDSPPGMKGDPHIASLEAQHWDRINLARADAGYIPMEADLRRANLVASGAPDPALNEIMFGARRRMFIENVAHARSGRVLDVCCGPGWLSLELGRRGQMVDAYDLSAEAIALAKRMLAQNPYTQGFGRVNYHVGDVAAVDLGHQRYDAVSGWSAFHHLPDLAGFLDRVKTALKPGGIVATMDDLPQGGIERGIGMMATGLLPMTHMTYPDKAGKVFKRLLGRARREAAPAPVTVESPMEAFSTQEIESLILDRFDVLVNVRFNAFVHTIVPQQKWGPAMRYRGARALTMLDRALCWSGLTKGVYRIIIARKRLVR